MSESEKKDRIIADLVDTIKCYAGVNDPDHNGYVKEGFFWKKYNGEKYFFYMDKFGHIYDAGGPELALKKLREYNLIE